MPRGPAGCLWDAATESAGDTFVTIDGTILPRMDLNALLEAHRQSDAMVTVVVADAGDGNGSSNGSSNQDRQPAGVYVFSRAVLDEIPDAGYQDIKESLIPHLYKHQKRVLTYRVDQAEMSRVTDAASYLALNMWAVQRLAETPGMLSDYEQSEDAWVHTTAQVHPSVRLMGPVLVGPGSVIEAGAMLVGPVSIGRNCRVERNAVVSRSALWDRCRLGPVAMVDHCVLTHDASVEPDLVVRQTVCIVPPRNGASLFRRLAGVFQNLRRGARVGSATLAYPLRA